MVLSKPCSNGATTQEIKELGGFQEDLLLLNLALLLTDLVVRQLYLDLFHLGN